MGKFIDLTGQRFGRLIVIKRDGVTDSKHTRWLCKCDCGNFSYVSKVNLKNGSTKSCGCLKKERFTNYKHGKVTNKLYYIYNGMKSRCYNHNNKAYKYYGERGINICDEWLDKKNGFISFYNWAIQNGYKENLSIDRIDVNGNYEPDNCRWATNIMQANNKRTNVKISFNNETHTLREWSKILNIPYGTLQDRIHIQHISLYEIFKKRNIIIKPVNQYDKDNNLIKKWACMSDIKKELNFNCGHICTCCKGKRKTAYGYIWRYANENNN